MILRHVKKVVQEYQDRKREGSIFSSFSADSLTSEERIRWRTIRKELERSGLTLAVLDNNRELIIQCVTAAIGSNEHQDHDVFPIKKGKGKGKAIQSASPVNQSLVLNPFMDRTFEVERNSREPRRPPLPFSKSLLKPDLDSSHAVKMPGEGDSAAKKPRAVDCARLREPQRTKILLLGQ